ncbi:RCC1 and BTB domain-containing protein 1 [Folsomia candida]|uniref:RCC1 and BTB domain-containing protein 1 n=1 Tax=Folsomia candida TaxID=158441 RepID=A0A226DC98_FOLCA|nr:RCC1 and BTB domain-containing protein 1 [Folsomia candida]
MSLSEPQPVESAEPLEEIFSAIPLPELNNFAVFRLLQDEPLLTNVKLAYVFGNTGLIVTTTDEVYSIGEAGGTKDMTVNLEKVEELCGVEVEEFTAGTNHQCFAITKTCKIYSWGRMKTGMYPVGDISVQPALFSEETFPFGMSELQRKQIIQKNNSTTMSARRAGAPQLISKDMFKNRQILQVGAAGTGLCAAICELGELYRWDSSSCNPQRALVSTTFKKIVSSSDSIFCLSKDGIVYKMVDADPWIPFEKINVVIDIAADPKFELCVFQFVSKMGIYGEFGGARGGLLRYRNYLSTAQAFQSYCPATLKTMKGKLQDADIPETPTVKDTIEAMWQDPMKNDISFSVEEKVIVANKAFLTIRSEYFEKMFSGDWKDGNEGITTIEKDCQQFIIIADVMILADSYCEFGIKEHCKNILQDTHITQHNALDLYKIGHINEIDSNNHVKLRRVIVADDEFSNI